MLTLFLLRSNYCATTFLLAALFHSQFGFASSDQRAMLFPPKKNSVKIAINSANYDFTHRSYFELGKQKFFYKDMRLESGTIRVASERMTEGSHFYHRMVGFVWPDAVISKGELSLISPIQGRKLFALQINEKSKRIWLSAGRRIRRSFEHLLGKSKIRRVGKKLDPTKVNFGIYPVPEKFKKVMTRTFRFCVEQKLNSSRVRICSPYYRLASKGQFVYVQKKYAPKASFILNGRTVPAVGTLAFEEGNLDFKAVLPNGFLFEALGPALALNMDQVLQDGDQLEVIGHGDIPGKALPFDDSYRLFESIGWKDTIEPKKYFWKLLVPRSSPVLPALAAGADFLGQKFSSEKFPQKKHVLILDSPTTSTYRGEALFKGSCLTACKLEAESGDHVEVKGNSFTWLTKLHKKNETSQKTLKVIDGTDTWVAQHEVFRATSTEVSIRASGLATLDATFSVLTEVSAAHWFESILGWQNSILSKQHWGVSVRHFQTLNDIVIATGFETLNWSTTTIDLKYRLLSGVWGLSETIGVIGSYQKVVLGNEEIPLMGGGIFWAKSMPELFDRMIRWLPFMDYPKWVDMEFLLYPTSLDSANTANLMWSLNFHGKILWSKSFFGEAGFGMRNVDFVGANSGFQFQFLAGYITLGIGYQF